MCYPHFNVFSTQKGLLCKFFYIFWVQVSALFLRFLKAFLDNSTTREVCAAGKSMLSVATQCPMKLIDFATNFGTSLFQPQSNLPDSPRWGHIKNQNTSYLPPPGDRSLIKSPYMPLLSPICPEAGRGGGGFNWIVHKSLTYIMCIVKYKITRKLPWSAITHFRFAGNFHLIYRQEKKLQIKQI